MSKVSIILGQGSWLMVNKPLIKIIGHIPAILLADLVTKWESFNYQEFYNSADQIYDSCYLTRRQVKRAVDQLVKYDLITYEVKDVPPKMHFNIKEDNIISLIFKSTEIQFRQNVKIEKTHVQFEQKVNNNLNKMSNSISTKCQNQIEHNVENYITKNKEQESITKNKNKNNPENEFSDSSYSPKNLFENDPDSLNSQKTKKNNSSPGRKKKRWEPTEKQLEIIVPVVDYLNEKAGRFIKYDGSSSKNIWDRYREKSLTVDEMKKIIDIKIKQWSGNPEMEKHLHPVTLFGPRKHEQYKEELEEYEAMIQNNEKYSEILDQMSAIFEEYKPAARIIYDLDQEDRIHLNSIRQKIKTRMQESGDDMSSETFLAIWRSALYRIDEFRLKSFSVKMIDNNLNQILSNEENNTIRRRALISSLENV